VHDPGDVVLLEGAPHDVAIEQGATHERHALGHELLAAAGEVVEDDRLEPRVEERLDHV
jgi:hypothetical protein